MSDEAYPVRVERFRALHEARARAELHAADALAPGSDAVAWRGAVIAEVALVKGLRGVAEASHGPAVSGADGEAAEKALSALGWPAGSAFFTLSRPEPGIGADAAAARLRAQLEAVDPRVVIALDAEAAADVAAALGVSEIRSGTAVTAGGRRIVAVDGFEASLGDESLKKRVWKQLQAARPEGPVY